MNLALVDPFVLALDYPDSLTSRLRSGHAATIRFNRKGDYLASGRLDGTIVIFDVETNGVARKLRGHTRQIQSLSWSRDGRYLLSSSQDWKCILWDLKDGSRVRTVTFEAPVYIAELHPYNPFLFVASLFEDQPVLVDLSSARPIKHILPSQPQADESSTKASKERKQSTCVTIFTALGNHILAGTSGGYFNIIETESRKIIHNCKHSVGNTMIVLLRLASNGRDILSNSTDRIIRTLHIDPDLSSVDLDPDVIRLEVEHKFQDIVNRLSWNHVAFSGASGEYVAASTYMNHDVYVWERSQGSLVKILEGPKEELGVLEWHPTRPLVAACGLETGCIYQWSIIAPQKWSALAPDFAEVEENVDYIEGEDEFDVVDAEEVHKRRLDLEDEEIDVLTIEPVKGEEEEPDAFRMPVLLDLSDSESEEEVVAVGPGTMRRKSPGASREWADEAKVDSGAEDKKANGTAGGRGQSRVKRTNTAK